MRSFQLGVIWRVAFIVASSFIGSWLYLDGLHIYAWCMVVVILVLSRGLYKYIVAINRKLTRLFDSIQYQDFAITFKADNGLGASFKDLNMGLNTVISSFNNIRAERESSLQFLQVVIQQIDVGMLSYNIDGKIEVANTAALKLLNVYRLNHINDIKLHNEGVYNCIVNLTKGTPVLQKIDNQELSFAVVEVSIRGRKIRLVSIHDIKTQLEHRESEAWQNLTKVLRHEIMNSVTPIVSMVETMQDIVEKDLHPNNDEEKEAVSDLTYALNTVQKRGLGIMKFVEAYREFTSIPKPQVQLIDVSELISNINQIHFSQLKSKDVIFNIHIEQDFQLLIDIDLIEQVLINIIKNATESGRVGVQLCIDITTKLNQKDKLIEIKDNGIGIDLDNQSKIFIPFFTSKATGSGIGLSLSRQIMQLHGGNITFTPNDNHGSVFGLSFVG